MQEAKNNANLFWRKFRKSNCDTAPVFACGNIMLAANMTRTKNRPNGGNCRAHKRSLNDNFLET